MSRTALLLVVVCLAVVNAVDIGRPLMARNKLDSRMSAHRSRIETARGAAEMEKLEHLRVAAAERETSLADQFAEALTAHEAVKAAAKVEAEAVAGMDSEAETESAVTAELAESNEAMESIDVAQAAENVAATESSQTLSIEMLQELEYQKSTKFAPKPSAAKSKPSTLQTDKMMWSNCGVATSKAAGASTFKYVTLRTAPPIRDMSMVVELDGAYKGPDVTYGSVTLQIKRLSSTETQAKDMPELAYRHSIVLSDVLAFNPFRATDPLSMTMYIPESAFNMYAPAGQYVLTVVLTNQNKEQFGCARIDFQLA